MKKKLAVFLLSMVLAVSGSMAISSSYTSAKAETSNPLDAYFEYDSSIFTFEADAVVPEYFTGGVSTNNNGVTGTSVNHAPGSKLGIGITAYSDGEFKFKKPIFLGDNNYYTPIFEHLITPAVKYDGNSTSVSSTATEFNRLTMVLTDVNDPSIYVEIITSFSSTNSGQSWIQVATPTQIRGGLNKGILTSEDKKNYGSGTGVQSGFVGCGNSLATLYYGYEDSAIAAWKCFYSESFAPNQSNKQVNIVRDLNNPAHLWAGDTLFTGFTSNFVNVSFKVEGLTAKQASFIIKSIDGQEFSLSGNEIVDATAPAIELDSKVLENIPKGETNKKYPFIPYTAYDVIDGSNVNVDISVFDANGNKVTTDVYDDYFIPRKSGKYTIKYKAIDKSLNESKEPSVEVYISEVLEDFRLVFTDPSQIITSASIGKSINVPQVKLVGGSGNNSCKKYVTYVETGEIVSEFDIFTPSRPGWYRIVYEYKDYTSELRTMVLDIDVTVSDKPVFDGVTMPKAVLSGKKFYIPTAMVKDYASFNGEGREVDFIAEVKVEGLDKNGTPVSIDWTKVDEYYTPTVVSGTLSLRYKAASILDEDVVGVSEVYTSEIVSLLTTKELYKFFYATGNVETQSVTIDGVSKQVVFTPNSEGDSLQFINKLQAKGFQATINFDEQVSSINEFKVVIQDSEKAVERLTLTYRMLDASKSIVVINGTEYKTEGSFVSIYKEIAGEMSIVPGAIKVRFKDNYLYDSKGQVGEIKYFDDGSLYTGFSSGSVYFTLEFTDLDESKMLSGNKSSIRFTDFCGTPRFAVAGGDKVVPSIILAGDLSTFYDLNTFVTLPSAVAIDVIDPNVTVSLTVTDPFGNVVLNGVPADKDYVLHLDKIGQYIIDYISYDQSANKGNLQLSIYSADTFAPVIEIAGQFNSTAKMGETYKIHKAIAYDNYDKAEELVIYVYVFGPDGYIETVAHGAGAVEDVEYEFAKPGTYRIRYFCMDSYGNYIHKIFYVTAS